MFIPSLSSSHFVMQDQAQEENPLNGDFLQKQDIQRYGNQVAFMFYFSFTEGQLFEQVAILAACSKMLCQIT